MDCYVMILSLILVNKYAIEVVSYPTNNKQLVHEDALVSTQKQTSRKNSDESSKMQENNQLTIRGRIIFRGGAPDNIPDGSTLTVKFEDTSRMDAPAIKLGNVVQTINGYRNGDTLDYEIKVADNKRPMIGSGTLSAVLNMGWVPHGNEWIRRGDWLNDTSHEVDVSDNKNEYYGKDVEIMHYS